MRIQHLTLLLAATLALSGCKTLQSSWNSLADSFRIDPKDSEMDLLNNTERKDAEINPDYCPRVDIVDELSSLSEFSEGSREGDLLTRVSINQVESACAYRGGAMVVDLRLSFTGALGPQARQQNSDKPFFAYPFFVAVVDQDEEVLAKEVFAASMTYPPGQNQHVYIETLRQLIPADSLKDGPDFKILLGFQLTEDQLRYNRKNMVRAPKVPVTAISQQPAAPAPVAATAPPAAVTQEKLPPDTKTGAPQKLAR